MTSASRKAKGEPSQRPESPASGPVSQPPGAGPLPPPVRRTRWLIGSFLGLSMVGVVIFAYLRIERELEATLKARLEAILRANVQSAEEWLADQETLARRFADQPPILALVTGLSETHEPSPKDQAALDRAAASLTRLGLADAIVILHPDGHSAAASGGVPSPLPVDLFTQFRSQDAFVRVASLRPSEPLPGKVMACSKVRVEGRHRAGVCLLVDSAGLHRRLRVASWGRSGETFAFDRTGAFLTVPRFESLLSSRGIWPTTDPEFVPQVVIPGARSRTRMAAAALDGKSGIDVSGYTSYLGWEVVGAWQVLPPYGITIATELSRAEAHESVGILRAAFVTLATLLGLALLGFILLGRWTLHVRQEAALAHARLVRLARTIQPLSAALENDPSAVLLVDDGGEVVYANAASHVVLEIHGPLVGKHIEQALENLQPELQEALDSGHDSIVARGDEGEGGTLLVSSRLLTIDGRRHFLYMLRPVTQEVRRQELENLRKLIRVLSHELNNSLAPITSLVNSARKLNERGEKDEKLERVFTALEERANHLLAFLKRYGAVARLPQPVPRPVDWRPFISGLACQGTFRLSGELPSEPGFFDPVQLERVLLNLVANAREAQSPEQEVELRVMDDGNCVKIEVLDRGTGMSAHVLRQALLPFFSTKEGGTGIGLALSREIIEAHGGNLVLANREGGGLVATATLPKLSAQPAARGSLSQLRILPPPDSSTKDRILG